jgi:hypothetical protein
MPIHRADGCDHDEDSEHRQRLRAVKVQQTIF